jgi:hypothetical protein
VPSSGPPGVSRKERDERANPEDPPSGNPRRRHLVVRGDEDPEVQERMARVFLRRYPSWGRYGLSAYHASGDEDVDLLCRVELVRFPFVAVLRRPALEETIEIVPTGHRPHVTLASAGLATLLAGIAGAIDRRANPYHVSERS